MLEWMHDPLVVRDLRTDFSKRTENDCCSFIVGSWNDENNLHLAIVNEEDEYLGTVSLKNIENGHAEFAITIRASAMGKGLAKSAMQKILEIGFNEKCLESIYWCVSSENKRAMRFYIKNGYKMVSPEQIIIRGDYSKEEVNSYYWFCMKKADYVEMNE